MKNQNRFQAMKAVYTYFFPEVRNLVNLNLDSDLFFTTTPAEQAQDIIDSLGFRKKLVVPSTTEGNVDLDGIHEPVIDRVIEIYERIVPELSGFKFRYFTPGSSDGIFHVLAELRAKGVQRINTLEGEYEGYREYGKTLGIETVEHNPKNLKPSSLEKGVWFISNPSAINGNIIPNKTIEDICNSGSQVNLDLAYVGATREQIYDVSNPNIKAVFLSFSKPYGVFRWRIGFTFSREPVQSLYANKWFKDIERVLTSLKLAEEFGPGKLYTRYRSVQERIVQNLNQDFSLGIIPSDVLLLGHITPEDAGKLNEEQREMISQYNRGSGYRFCLTPYFEREEKGGIK